MPAKSRPLEVVIDSREQQPLVLPQDVVCHRTGLKTGDYSVFGLESVITIERKASPAELAGNVFKGRDRFGRELERMEAFKEAHVVLCFSLDDLLRYPHDQVSCLPRYVRSQIRVTGQALLKRLLELQREFPWVHWWFAGDRAVDITLAILKAADRIYEKAVDLEQGVGLSEPSVINAV